LGRLSSAVMVRVGQEHRIGAEDRAVHDSRIHGNATVLINGYELSSTTHRESATILRSAISSLFCYLHLGNTPKDDPD